VYFEEVPMREFYEACEEAMDSKKTVTAIERLKAAHTIMQPIVDRAKTRLEFHLMTDLRDYLQWTASWVIYKMEEGKGEWPGLEPYWLCALGTTYVYPPNTKNRSSLDYRWSKWKDLPETMLPSVPRHTGMLIKDKTVYGIAR
jgi:hypothetical protein